MKMSVTEMKRIISYLMYELVENTGNDYDRKEEILAETLVNDFNIEFED